MSESYNPAYIALVAALRGQFSPLSLHAIDIQIRDNFGPALTGAVGVLARAVHDAWDITFDAGEKLHPAVREFLQRARAGDSPWPSDTPDGGDR